MAEMDKVKAHTKDERSLCMSRNSLLGVKNQYVSEAWVILGAMPTKQIVL